MKKLVFLSFMMLVVCFFTYAQNADFNSELNKPNIQGFSEYSPLTSATWSVLPVTPHAVSRSCCAAIKRGDTTFIYQFGGGATTQLTNVAKYNSITNTWTNNVTTIPFPISAGWAVALPGDSIIYVIGGDNVTAAYGRCLKYNIITNTWTTMAVMTTNPCTDQLTVVYRDSLIYCVGGGDGLFGTTVQYNSVRIFNTKTNTWTTATNLPVPLSMSGGGILGDTIYIFCGASAGTYLANCYKGVINSSNITQITWTTLPNYPGGAMTRMASTFVKVGNSAGIACAFGAVGGATLSSAANLWNICTQSWQTLPAGSLARSNLRGTGLRDSSLYCVAGYTTVGVGNVDKLKFSLIDGSCLITSINNQSTIPVEFNLSQNYPNPFNPVTKIKYSIPKAGLVKLSVYDILGKEVEVLVNEYRVPGNYIVDFEASKLFSGVYFYKLTSGDFSDTKKMMLIK
ncbi:MAG: T9SS type A sorting domain-containing protein, partial [Ignavibacteriae bacterium]|nr:T9SS type A sorting domain-containing protein [Ignavibacteriota bacterium]